MPRCVNCGKANREGSLFCQDCGQRIEDGPAGGKGAGLSAAPAAVAGVVQVPLPAGAVQVPLPAGAVQVPLSGALAAAGASPQRRVEGTACSLCGTMNPPGMNFCKMCGTALSAAQARSAPPPGRVTCGQCGKSTPSGFAFCQHCGHRLAGEAIMQSGQGGPAVPLAAPPVQPVMPSPTPPAGVRMQFAAPGMLSAPIGAGGQGQQAGQGAGPFVGQMPRQGDPGMAGQMPMQGGQGAGPFVGQMSAPPGNHVGHVGHTPGGPGGAAAGPPVVARGGQPLLGRLITVRRDGSDGDIIPLTGESFDIGRSEGSLSFAEDPYLAGRHARLVAYGGVVRVRPIDTVNGVFLRLREPHDLQPGDIFYIGKELLRFESLAAEERDPPALVEHGVRLFGSVQREAWGRLRQLSSAGVTRDIWYLSRSEIVLGREEGDIVFPDDEFMSRRHALLSRSGGRPRLLDQNSSNGTYLRLRGDRELRPSDVLRMGDQLLRFEP